LHNHRAANRNAYPAGIHTLFAYANTNHNAISDTNAQPIS